MTGIKQVAVRVASWTISYRLVSRSIVNDKRAPRYSSLKEKRRGDLDKEIEVAKRSVKARLNNM